MEIFERGVTPQNMLEMAGAMIVVLDVDGGVIFVNERTCRVLGFEKDEIVGKNWFDSFVPPVMRGSARRIFKRLIDGEISDLETYENPLLTKTGGERDISWSNVLLRNRDNVVIGTVSSGNDITERKKTLDLIAYQAGLIDIVNDAIIARDPDMTIKIWNKAAETLYGWTAEEVIGKGPGDMSLGYHGIDQRDLRDRLEKEDRIRWEAVQERKDGTKIHVEGITVTSRDAYGRINGFVSVNRDISSRVKAEEDLRSTRDYLENLVNFASAPIIVWDPSFKITRFSKASERMTGYYADEVVGGDLDILFPSDTREDSLTKIKKTLEGEQWESVEIPILRKDGGLRWVLWNSANVYAEDGKTLVATIAQGQDITDRKNNEEDLRETRNYLENLVNYANAPIIVWDTSFRITRFNHAFERLTGHFAHEVIGQELSILFPKGSSSSSLMKIGRTLSGEQWESVEIPILKKDGAVRIALWNSANIYAEDGKTLVATIAQGQDITERVRAEEALRSTRNYLESLVDYANAPIIVWDSSSRITRFNHAFERLTGYWTIEVIGKHLRMLFPAESRDQSLIRISQTLSGQYWESVEIPILRKDGRVRVALWNSANIYSEDGKTLVATIAQGQDITERKQAEEKLIALNENLARQKIELEAVNRELEAFNYSVSHDLRAPLRAMDGFSTALIEDYSDSLDGTGKDYLNRIRDASQRMAQLIDDLLKLSRVTREKMNWEMVDLSSIAKDVARELQRTQPDRKVDFVICEDARMRGDSRLLKILMENVIGNAWKFTSMKDGPRIEFGTTSIDGEVVFYVKDNGAGFDMKYADKLFTPFQRLHSAKEFPGSGVGLATSMRIIRRHGGRIWAEGAIGEGTTFYFGQGKKGESTPNTGKHAPEAEKHG